MPTSRTRTPKKAVGKKPAKKQTAAPRRAVDSRVVDLDAAKAARAEARGAAPSLRFGGEDFPLPPELPFDVLEALTADGARDRGFDLLWDAARLLLGDAGYERFRGHRPSTDDLEVFTELVFAVYGIDAGEADGSTDS